MDGLIAWLASHDRHPCRPSVFTDAAIWCCLTIKVLSKLPSLRTSGMEANMLSMAGRPNCRMSDTRRTLGNPLLSPRLSRHRRCGVNPTGDLRGTSQAAVAHRRRSVRLRFDGWTKTKLYYRVRSRWRSRMPHDQKPSGSSLSTGSNSKPGGMAEFVKADREKFERQLVSAKAKAGSLTASSSKSNGLSDSERPTNRPKLNRI